MHQTRCVYPAGDYVKLTFMPAGAKRSRTVWAIQIGPNRFYRAACDGGLWETETVSCELILTGGKHTIQPAGLSLHYGKLEVMKP